VELSCAGLRGELLASELFGHTRGAFTSAVSDREGLLDVADGGTLFLDEIGELDTDVQAQFLKVLEEKRYRRVGDTRERRSEFRLICATNRELEQHISSGRFRAELFFRINVFPIRLPPLRRRRDELPVLTAHLLATLGSPHASVSGPAMELLRSYPWPGNVRELRNALERALLLSRSGRIGPEHLVWLADATQAAAPVAVGESWFDESRRIEEALRQHGGRVADAARALGVSRATLYRKLRALRSGDGA
jgi:DNA-binding NtrC family response regulator